MNILITGGSGFIGRELVRKLSQNNHFITVLTRSISKTSNLLGAQPNVEFCSILDQISSSSKIDYIINLAGAPVADLPWTKSRRKILFQSRINVTKELILLIKRLKYKPKRLISTSAIGWYGPGHSDLHIDETYQNFTDSFTHNLCDTWEKTALEAREYSVEVSIIRLGMVLSYNGGMLKKLSKIFRYHLGFYIGTGDHYLSWIHLNDVINGILFLMQNNEGKSWLYNFTSPEPVTNKLFSQELAKVLGSIIWFKIPKFIISLMLGDMGRELLLSDIRALPQNLIDSGFQFEFQTISHALEELLLRTQET